VLICTTIPDNSLKIKHQVDYPRLATALLSVARHLIAKSNAADPIHGRVKSGTVSAELYYDEVINADEAEDAKPELNGALRCLRQRESRPIPCENFNIRISVLAIAP
jgi:hypothetical protein